MAEEMNYADFLHFLKDLNQPLPYDNGTIRIFLDALATTIAMMDFIPLERRSASQFLQGLWFRSKGRMEQLAGAPSDLELQQMIARLAYLVGSYQHLFLQDSGNPLATCALHPACPHHPSS